MSKIVIKEGSNIVYRDEQYSAGDIVDVEEDDLRDAFINSGAAETPAVKKKREADEKEAAKHVTEGDIEVGDE